MKPQDVMLLCLLIANKESRNFKQSELAKLLCMSSSTINKSINRLEEVGLISSYVKDIRYYPVKETCIEFFTKCFGYIFLPKEHFHPKIAMFIDNKLHSYESIIPITHMWSLIELAWKFPKPLDMTIKCAIASAINEY